jgi:hypothetical protein
MLAQSTPITDAHTQLRTLYRSLLNDQEKFHEFKELLAQYPSHDGDEEPAEAARVRERLNGRISEWLAAPFGLNATQVILWRAIVVEQRFNVALSPWQEANAY